MVAFEESVQVPVPHDQPVHDGQLDFFGNNFAMCSSDHTVSIFEKQYSSKTEQYKFVHSATLRGHKAPVWQVDWCPPYFGILILATCSDDGCLKLWTNHDNNGFGNNNNSHNNSSINSSNNSSNNSFNSNNNDNDQFDSCPSPAPSTKKKSIWRCVYSKHWSSPITSLAFCPISSSSSSETISNPSLAVAVSVHNFGAEIVSFSLNPDYNYNNIFPHGQDIRETELLKLDLCSRLNDEYNCNSVSWSPDSQSLALGTERGVQLYNRDGKKWQPHQNRLIENVYVQDVSFSPSLLSTRLLAACGMVEDNGMIFIFYLEEEGISDKTIVLPNKIIWNVSWSTMGDILIVSTTDINDDDDKKIYMYKQPLAKSDEWISIDADEL